MSTPHEAAYAPLTKSDVYAIKALAEGKADPGQQVAALNWIIQTLLGTYDWPYRPDGMGGERATHLYLGKQHAGLQLRRIIAQPMKLLVPDGPDHPAKVDGDLKE